MWGFGGRHYWGRRTRQGRVEGVVVAFAWMSSQDKHLRSYVQLYELLWWNSLVCHSQFLNMFFPEKALPLAVDVVKELVNELRIRACPIVFASFSGGPKACMSKVLEVLEGQCEAQLNMDDIRLARDCIAGFIYDSCPIDFMSDLGARFVVHPTVLKMSHPPRFPSWAANGIASGLDALFLTRFESQRAKYWQTLYSTIHRAPYLILCSENDDLAPYQTICNFAGRMQDLGGDVKLVTWKGSPHGLPVKFCQMHLPKADMVINLIDDEGKGSPVIYLARKTGISGGWRGFSISHDLADGDAVIFQLIQPTTMKVYIIRVSSITKDATG